MVRIARVAIAMTIACRAPAPARPIAASAPPAGEDEPHAGADARPAGAAGPHAPPAAAGAAGPHVGADAPATGAAGMHAGANAPPARAAGPPVGADAPPPGAAGPHARASTCVDPLDDARGRLHAGSASQLELVGQPPDLDGDGQIDVVVRETGAREPAHVLYVMAGCARFVGRVDAFMLGCSEGRTNGLCDLWVDTWLFHGDRLRSRWQYDGKAYRKIDDGELVPGPRKH